MHLTDMLFEYIDTHQFQELRATEDYQAAWADKNAEEKALIASMTPKQRRLFHSYMEKRTYMDSLELQHFLSHCSLLFIPPGK